MNTTITRNPTDASRDDYDLIIVGAGIHGACLALEAARRGLRPLLLDRDDFGGGASLNSLRVLHGGLRYLQSLDFKRFAESVRERNWFMRTFPKQTRPLNCLMPLYGQGLKRRSVMRVALTLNDLLSRQRNRGLEGEMQLPAGGLLTRTETIRQFPAVEQDHLTGAAVWYDGLMECPQRILMEILRWACAAGATALNYVEAKSPLLDNDRVFGIDARDRGTGARHQFRAPVVIHCAGPWRDHSDTSPDQRVAAPFHPTLAFNLLLDREPPSDAALALTAPDSNAATYFLLPRAGKLVAGTSYVAVELDQSDAESTATMRPNERQIGSFLAELNLAVPSLRATLGDVVHIEAGVLPATSGRSSKPTRRATITDHSAHGGPTGLFTTAGIKYTTARAFAEKTLRRAFPHLAGYLSNNLDQPVQRNMEFADSFLSVTEPPSKKRHTESEIATFATELKLLVEEEAVLHLEDLLLRRTNWSDDLTRLDEIAQVVSQTLGWESSPIKTPRHTIRC